MEPLTRNGTLDRAIWDEVYGANEYRLKERMHKQIVLDIGCHIGAFSCAAKRRYVSEIFAAEMDFSNLNLAMHNVAAENGAAIFHPFHAAVWRSDVRGARLRNAGHDGNNTGGSWSLPTDSALNEVPTIPFDDLAKLASDWFRRRINLVKLDCEGAEWPILFTSQTLHIIDAICGEYHAGHFDSFTEEQKVQGVDYSIDALKQLLEANGFIVEIEGPNQAKYAHFWAERSK